MQISVVIPVHNEAENVETLAREVFSALSERQDFELIFVDDASRDNTVEKLRTLRQTLGSQLRIVRHPQQGGQSAAVVSGIRAARGAWIATMDGDGQNDPADIPALMAERDRQSVVDRLLVAGHRVQRQDTLGKKLSSKIANAVRGNLLGDNTPDTGCGLKLFRRDLFLELPYFDHMHRFLPALVLRAGGRIVSVPVNHRPRSAGVSKYGLSNRLWVGIVDMIGVMWLQRRAKLPVGVTEDE